MIPTPRRALARDARSIAEVEAAAAEVPWTTGRLATHLDRRSTAGWVIGDPIVGHLLSSVVADEAEILTLAVHPAHQRRGLARALLQATATAWRGAGVARGWLEVRVDNVAALALYRRAGWIDAGRRPRYYPDGTDAALMRWEAR